MKQLKPDESELAALRKEEVFLSKLEGLQLSDAGKALIEMIDESLNHAKSQWMGKGMTIDESELPVFRAKVKSKVDTLNSFRTAITESTKRKFEVQKILSEFEKGE